MTGENIPAIFWRMWRREEANELRAHLSDSGSEFPPCGALKPISSRLETSESDTCCLSHDDHKSRSELHRKASTESAGLGGEESVSSRKTPMLVFSETRESIGSSQDVGMRTTDLSSRKLKMMEALNTVNLRKQCCWNGIFVACTVMYTCNQRLLSCCYA